jgi:hypothetical protein
MIKNIYCPFCLEQDGLQVALNDLQCPQCGNMYYIDEDKLMEVMCDGIGCDQIAKHYVTTDDESYYFCDKHFNNYMRRSEE